MAKSQEVYTFAFMKKTELRKLRTHKTTDSIYELAKKGAKRNDLAMSRAIELFLKQLGKSKSSIITVNLTDK